MTEHQEPQLKAAFINLPYRVALDRRFSCTHYTPRFLFPPHELLQAATCAREWNQAEVVFLDAIAGRCGESEVHAFLARHKPDVMASIVGIESIASDLACLDAIKAAFPEITICIFGWYPTYLPEEILAKSSVDFILRGEPERPLSEWLKARAAHMPVDAIPGLAGRRDGGGFFSNPVARITNLDELPFPDYRLVDVRKYSELLLDGACGAILSGRGCPYRCMYCTTTYGRRLIQKSPEVVIDEMRNLISAGVRLIRFLDDTFTANRSRVLRICQGIVEQGLKTRWACLTRIDCLDEEMLAWMKRAGCVRILIGLESYSKHVLEHLDKGVDPGCYNAQLALIRKAGIQSVGYFILGAPIETEEDFQETLQGALAAPLDFLGVNILAPYAGTALLEAGKADIVFNLIPYECRFRDASVNHNAERRERTLYLRFYLRPSVILRQFRIFMNSPLSTMRIAFMIFRHFASRGRSDLF